MAINVKGFKDGLLRSLPLIVLIYVSISEFQTALRQMDVNTIVSK